MKKCSLSFLKNILQRKSWQLMCYVRNNFNTSVWFEYLQFPTVLSLEKKCEVTGLTKLETKFSNSKSSVPWRIKSG